MSRAADPTPVVRLGTYHRDGRRCVSCGRNSELTYQHRQATGMGGSQVRPTFVHGVTACNGCNAAFEHRLQRQALEFGWKVRRWVKNPGMVPVFDWPARTWYRLTLDGTRVAVGQQVAMDMMHEVYGDQYRPGHGLEME